LESLKSRVRGASVQAQRTLNTLVIELYWSLGKDILTRQEKHGWGSGVINRLAADLRLAFPDMKGLSAAQPAIHDRYRENPECGTLSGLYPNHGRRLTVVAIELGDFVMEKLTSPEKKSSAPAPQMGSAAPIVAALAGPVLVILLTGYLTMQLQAAYANAVLGFNFRVVGVSGEWLPYVWRLGFVLLAVAAILAYRRVIRGTAARLATLTILAKERPMHHR
jgi:hypothetical protein